MEKRLMRDNYSLTPRISVSFSCIVPTTICRSNSRFCVYNKIKFWNLQRAARITNRNQPTQLPELAPVMPLPPLGVWCDKYPKSKFRVFNNTLFEKSENTPLHVPRLGWSWFSYLCWRWEINQMLMSAIRWGDSSSSFYTSSLEKI